MIYYKYILPIVYYTIGRTFRVRKIVNENKEKRKNMWTEEDYGVRLWNGVYVGRAVCRQGVSPVKV